MSDKLLLLLLLLLKCIQTQGRQKIAESPISTTAHLSDTVTLRCRVENQEGAVQWLKGGFGLGSDRELSYYPRYSMIGSPSQGEYHLQIENVTFSDESEYECFMESTYTSQSQVSQKAYLKVMGELKKQIFGIY